MYCLDSSAIIVNSDSFPSKFSKKLSELEREVSHNKNNDWQEIQNRLKVLTKEQSPWLEELATKIVQMLNFEQGFVVIKGLSFHLYERPIADYLYLSLAAHLGLFTAHSNSGNVIWDVTPRPCLNQRKPTFSELNNDAPLHIDSAFRHQSELYFGLFAIKSAKEGGNSIIVDSSKLVQSLQSSFFGKECLKILREQEFPFEVPPAFRGTSKSNVILAPIVADNPVIRFRLDTIEAGFKCHPKLATADRLWALEYFNTFLKAYPHKIKFKLDDGDVVFVNNHKVLHGRTAFAGSDRLLLRVRINHDCLDTSEAEKLNHKIPVAM